MADFVFNIAKGKIAQYAGLPGGVGQAGVITGVGTTGGPAGDLGAVVRTPLPGIVGSVQ